MNPILSILTPSVPSRLKSNLPWLCGQIEKLLINSGDPPVEHLVFLDNKKRTVGEKRDALLRMARGKYVAFVDDDDKPCDLYLQSILPALATAPDVVTFRQQAIVNNVSRIIEFKLGNPNEPFDPTSKDHGRGHVVKRNAWHVCVWRRSLAIQSHFPASNYGEDWAFAASLCAMAGLREVHIPDVLHIYEHHSATTEAPPPLTAGN